MSLGRRQKDRGRAGRASAKHSDPVARQANSGLADAIMEQLSVKGVPLELEDVFGLLDAEHMKRQRAVVKRRDALERSGQIVRNRSGQYGLARKMDLVTGTVQGHRDGYGFLIPDEGEGDLFLSPRRMRELMHGDRVIARVVGLDDRGRKEGAVVEVLERAVVRVVGRFWREGGTAFVRPEHVRMHQDVLIPAGKAGAARHGDMVVVDITEPPSRHHPPLGNVVEALGDGLAPGMETEVAIRTYEIPNEFSSAALAQAEGLSGGIPALTDDERKDIRSLPLVTIDGIDAKDFDDAVHCVATKSGWKLTVAIADVSAYVRAGDALDKDAQRRGTSVYFPQRVVPMLPEVLSNGLCSLRPHEDRLCLVCEMSIGRDGRIRRSRFFSGVMRSRARLTYDEVAKVLVDKDQRVRDRLGDLAAELDALFEVYKALRTAREARGALDLDSSESSLSFDAQGKVTAIVPLERNAAHCLIEECMIAANVATARFLERHRLISLFRIHDGPDKDKLADLRAMLRELGLTLGGGAEPRPVHYAALIDTVRGKPESPVVQLALLRSLTQAVYSPANAGHFGLGLQRYMHFTSPIRRYPDLVVHRAIKQALRGGRRNIYPYGAGELEALGKHCSMTERRAEDATRDVVYRLKCEFLAEREGEVFSGVISGVTGFGLFVTLSGADVSGLVHVSALGSDYFHFDPASQQLRGEHSGKVFKLGDPLEVRVHSVSPQDRRIDLELVDSDRSRPYANRPRTSRRSHGRAGRRSVGARR